MGTLLGLKYIPYTYMDPLGYVSLGSLGCPRPEIPNRGFIENAASYVVCKSVSNQISMDLHEIYVECNWSPTRFPYILTEFIWILLGVQ